MTKRSIFAKIFLITFALFSGLVILLHASVYFIFPSTYIESQRQTILKKSQALAKSFQGQEEGTIESVIDLYSKTNDIKVSIKGKEKQNALEVKDDLLLNPNSQNNSLVIEERKIETKEGKDLTLQFLATVDSQKEARDISLGFLPYSLLASFVLSLLASYLYARLISAPILEIKQMTKRMKRLDRTASLPIHSQDEIGVLKQQINDLYHHLLEVIDNLEQQKQENLKLEQMKVEFLRGASHELKTPLMAMSSLLSLARKSKDYENTLEQIKIEIKRMDNLLDTLLLITQLEEKTQLSKEKTELTRTIRSLTEQFQLQYQEKKLTLELDLPESLEKEINSQGRNSIISNLIGNAFKFVEQEGRIKISLSSNAFQVRNS